MPLGTPLVEAAELLGVTADSLRKRARRGTVEAYKQGDEWYVIVPNGTNGTQATGQATSQATARAAQAIREPLEQAVAAVIATLREQLLVKDQQIAEKDIQLTERDRQLAAREREVSELHVLLQTTQRLIPPVVATASERNREGEEKIHDLAENTAPERSMDVQGASENKPVVSWWRRLFLGEM